MQQLQENETVRYRVMCGENVLLESTSKHVAENFIATLSKSTQEQVLIIPVTADGLQVLLG
jgi:hypothetical protein